MQSIRVAHLPSISRKRFSTAARLWRGSVPVLNSRRRCMVAAAAAAGRAAAAACVTARWPAPANMVSATGVRL
jgi:hypothetical protein